MNIKGLIGFAGCLLVTVSYAENPVTKAYVDAQDQRLQVQINNSSSSGNSGHNIGEYYQGGVIYWIDPSTTHPNQHGLIADIADKGTLAWSSANTITGATLEGAFQGENSATGCGGAACNTAKILATAGATYAAASACATSTSQGYSDWYLPSIQELAGMFFAQMDITAAALEQGGSAFASVNGGSSSTYWSSTEYSSSNAATFSFSRGFMNYLGIAKSGAKRVRCIRAF